MNKEAAVKLSKVNFSYNSLSVLEEVSFELEPNDFVAIVGPNGGGKTTLVKLILGELQAQSGEVTVLGGNPQIMCQRIGYVPQFSSHNKQYPISVFDVVLSGAVKANSILPFYSKLEKQKANSLLKQMKIADLKNNQVNELSGGQMQRMLIARAMMTDPDILILDEPTASVDIAMEQDIFELLHELNSDKTILVISHNVSFVSKYANKIICLNRKLVMHNTSDVTSDSHESELNQTEIIHHCQL